VIPKHWPYILLLTLDILITPVWPLLAVPW
jgi:hypothetical protein